MTAFSRKAKVLPKMVTELDLTKSRYPSLNYPKSRSELASVLAIITSFWRIRCIGNKQESLKMSHFDLLEAIPDLPSTIFFYTLPAFDYFFFTLTWSSVHLLFSSLLKIERKHAGNGSFDSKGSWRWCKGDVEVPFKIWVFSSLPVLVETV